MSEYAELHCLSNYSFLRGASHPSELVERAHALNYRALALTDECSLAGIVRAHVAAKAAKVKLIIGTEIQLHDGPKLVLLAPDKTAYSQICQLITQGRRAAEKGQYLLHHSDLENDACDHCLALLLPPQARKLPTLENANWMARHFSQRAWLGVELHRDADDAIRLKQWTALANESGLPLVACGDVHMHQRQRRVLQDTITAIRHGCTLHDAGERLFANGERHLRKPASLAQIYPATLISETVKIAARCSFSMDQLQYRYPAEVPAGMDANSYLRQLTEQGLQRRWPQGTPENVSKLIEKELQVIQTLDCPQYFLTVYEIMQWARQQGILCQGRGSAGNSAVCFALGITVVNPAEQATLFERFLSAERKEPPDIDVDFEHDRRELVFQHIYQKYGRERAALAATVIRYRPKSAIRDIAKVLGFSQQDIVSINQSLAWWDQAEELPQRLKQLGFNPDAAPVRMLFELLQQLLGAPRHLSQHVGGFVICEQALDQLVPIENAAMNERTVIQWEKRDLEELRLFKVDCLALGMLTAIHKSFDLIQHHSGQQLDIAEILKTADGQHPQGDAVFRMLSRAQSVGVFQVESRAQMSMLPRMQPRNLYDLTVETAIVRPGPIQGGMVHPYLERRERARKNPKEHFDCPPQLRKTLDRTYGIPIFQEQVMDVCVHGAGFAPGEANQVRRSMAAWGRSGYGKLAAFEQKLKDGFQNNGIDAEFADRIFQQIQGFSEYGFPEAHAASFASLAYVSAWLKRFHPAAFLCGLLNSQPMGFYTPSQLIQDFRRLHKVHALPPDVSQSQWQCTLELGDTGRLNIRLGLRQIKGLSEDTGQRIAHSGIQTNCSELFIHCNIGEKERHALAKADALRSLTGDRHQAHWSAQGHIHAHTPMAIPLATEGWAELTSVDEAADVSEDYASMGLSLRRHPVALIRQHLAKLGILSARQCLNRNHGQRCQLAGMVTNRQRPGSALGIIFMTLEDDTGTVNVVVRQQVLKKYRIAVLQAPFVVVDGIMENRKGVRHFLALALHDRSELLQQLTFQSRDFH
ncbi:MAG: error-prone DNA polymerase [Oceanococcus sp.]